MSWQSIYIMTVNMSWPLRSIKSINTSGEWIVASFSRLHSGQLCCWMLTNGSCDSAPPSLHTSIFTNTTGLHTLSLSLSCQWFHTRLPKLHQAQQQHEQLAGEPSNNTTMCQLATAVPCLPPLGSPSLTTLSLSLSTSFCPTKASVWSKTPAAHQTPWRVIFTGRQSHDIVNVINRIK